MSEEKVTKKVVRRGVNNETRSTSQLKFHEKDAANNGLFIGHLEEVTVDFRTLKEDTKGLQSFAGKAIPRLVFHFTSNHPNVDERRHVYQTLLPVESNVDTIPGGKNEWQVNNVLAWIKHLLEIYYFKGRLMTEEEEAALGLNFMDYDEKTGEYVSVDADDVLAAYQTLFESTAAILNGTLAPGKEASGKPVYRDANGKFIRIWIKLLRFIKRKNEWVQVGNNGDLSFNTFVGEGAIELFKEGVNPAKLYFDATKESITHKEVKKAPNLGGVGIPGAGVIAPGFAGPAMGGFQDGDASAFNDAGSDMPF